MRKEALQTEALSGHVVRRLGMLLALVAMALVVCSTPSEAPTAAAQ